MEGQATHNKYERADQLSKIVIGAAIEVQRQKGAGLIESIYEKCLMRELELRGIPTVNQIRVPIEYKGYIFKETLRLDMIVDDCLIIELKVVKEVLQVHKAQLLSYMKLMDMPIGLAINFYEPFIKNGICRLVLKGAGG